MYRIKSLVLAAAVSVSLGACSSGGDGGTDPGATPAIAVGLGIPSASVVQGGSAPVTATLTRSGGFTGTVSLTVEGAPAGVTASVGAPSTSGGTTTATVTIQVSVGTAPGTYPLTVRGTGAGVAPATAPFTLTVTQAPPAPSYILTLSAPSASILQGANAPVTVTITRTNFSDAVALAVTGLPTGVTVAFAPAAPTGTTSTLTITAAPTAIPGTYPLQVTGTASAGNQSLPFSLTVTAAPSYTISLSASSATIVQGGNAPVTVTLTRTNFAGAVTLGVTGLPSGVTAAFTPAAPTGDSSVLTLTVGPSAVAGVYPLQVTGTASAGNPSLPFSLTIVVPSISIALNPPSVTIAQGGSATSTVTITRNNFPGQVSINMVPAAGFTMLASPQITTGNISTITVTAAASVAPGIYNLTIIGNDATVGAPASLRIGKASAAAIQPATAPLQVTVTTAQPAAPITLDYSACIALFKPLWAAYQDGPGAPWIRVVGVNDVYTINGTQSRVGFATVTSQGSTAYFNQTRFLSRTELAALGPAVCQPDPGQVAISARGNNVQTGQFFRGIYNGTVSLSNNFQIDFAVARTLSDLIVYAAKNGETRAQAGVLIRRGLDTRTAASPVVVSPPLDLTSEPVQVAAAQITVQNRNGQAINVTPQFAVLGTSCVFNPWEISTTQNSDVFESYGMPGSMLLPTDMHLLRISTTDPDGASRSVTELYRTHVALTLPLPNALPPVAPTIVSASIKSLRVQMTVPSAFNSVSLNWGSGRLGFNVSVPGYLNGGPLDITTPDFTGMPGWNPAWSPSNSTTATWDINASGGLSSPNVCQTGPGRQIGAGRRGTI